MDSDSDSEKECCRVCRRSAPYYNQFHARCRRLIKRIKKLESDLLNKEFELFLRNYYHHKFSKEEL